VQSQPTEQPTGMLVAIPKQVSVAQAHRALELVGQLTRTSPRHYLHVNPDTGTIHCCYLGPNERGVCTCPGVLKGHRACYVLLAARLQARGERARRRHVEPQDRTPAEIADDLDWLRGLRLQAQP
jgi:hypothetical protein